LEEAMSRMLLWIAFVGIVLSLVLGVVGVIVLFTGSVLGFYLIGAALFLALFVDLPAYLWYCFQIGKTVGLVQNHLEHR
jgi:hypothetical protein